VEKEDFPRERKRPPIEVQPVFLFFSARSPRSHRLFLPRIISGTAFFLRCALRGERPFWVFFSCNGYPLLLLYSSNPFPPFRCVAVLFSSQAESLRAPPRRHRSFARCDATSSFPARSASTTTCPRFFLCRARRSSLLFPVSFFLSPDKRSRRRPPSFPSIDRDGPVFSMLSRKASWVPFLLFPGDRDQGGLLFFFFLPLEAAREPFFFLSTSVVKALGPALFFFLQTHDARPRLPSRVQARLESYTRDLPFFLTEREEGVFLQEEVFTPLFPADLGETEFPLPPPDPPSTPVEIGQSASSLAGSSLH